MKQLLSAVFAVVFALSLAAPAEAQRSREEETVERTLTLEPGGRLRLKTFSGRVTITGASGNQVVIKALRRASRDRLNDIKLEITQSGNLIEIDANHRIVERENDNVVETIFDIQVPSRTLLELKSFSAPIRVSGVAGEVRANSFSGDISVESAGLDQGEDLSAETFSGDIALRLPDSVRGSVSFNSFSGSFTSDLPVSLTTSSRRNFRGELNGGGTSDFRLKTFSGDVTIRK